MFLTRCCQPLGPIAGNPQRLRQKWLHNDKLPYPHESYFHFPAKVNSHSFNYQLFYGILVYCLGTFQVLEENYQNYQTGLQALQLDSLEKRRKTICLNFAQTSIADGHFRDLFPMRRENHQMATRHKQKFKVFKAHTERFKNSPILTMQRMLNKQT